VILELFFFSLIIDIDQIKILSLIFTDLAVTEVTPAGLVLKEITPGFIPEKIQAVTEPKLIIASDLKEIEL